MITIVAIVVSLLSIGLSIRTVSRNRKLRQAYEATIITLQQRIYDK